MPKNLRDTWFPLCLMMCEKLARRVTRQRSAGETVTFRDYFLLDRAANLRKHVVGIRPDEANRSDDDYQDHRQHDRVFRDILAALITPKLL